jgi:hypothetical protein
MTLIFMGGLLIALPTLYTQRNLARAAAYYELHGGGAQLPEELRVQPHSHYDWASLCAGTSLALAGALIGRQSKSTTT